MALTSSTSTSTPSLRSWLARRANSTGKSTFGGSLTSSRAMITPSTICASGAKAFRAAGTSSTASDTSALQGGVLAILLLGLVAVEFIGAQPYAGCNRGRLLRLHRAVGQFGDHAHGIVAGDQLAGGGPAEFQKIIVLDRRQFAGADHDQAGGLEALRRQNIERRPALALELIRGRRALDDAGRRAERLEGRRAEFQRVVAKYHQKPTRGCGKRNEADLDGVGHRQILQKSGLSPARDPARNFRFGFGCRVHPSKT